MTKEKIANQLSGRNKYWQGYYQGVIDHLKGEYGLEIKKQEQEQEQDNEPYIFVIDEINRGEISKIFGELFFSIDPSYRGKKGAVKTQYANMHIDPDDDFYVPENVYIIGTMNDIDRSVESFDFAMRRRFTWEEITAEDSAERINLPQDIKDRMKALNGEIAKTDGLNASYQIGGAYFLDADGNANTDCDAIWKYRLAPLLKEYLRSMPDAQEKLEKLENVFCGENNNDNIEPENTR